MEHAPSSSYEFIIKQAESALTARRVDEALELFTKALELVDLQDTKKHIDTEQKVALCQSMLGQHEKALETFRRLEQEAATLDDPELQSAVLRDFILAIDRDPKGNAQEAHQILDTALTLTNNENNRLALTGIRGRLFMKEHKPKEALAAHKSADEGWDELRSSGKQMLEQWQFNNLLHYYEAAKAMSDETLARSIRERMTNDTERFTPTHEERLAAIDDRY